MQFSFIARMLVLATVVSIVPAHAVKKSQESAQDEEAVKNPLTQVYKLPVWINGVTRVCPWRSNAGQGYIRVIRGDTLAGHSLYLQWVRKGIAEAPTQATSTVEVEELRDDYQVRIEMPVAKLGPHSCSLSAVGEDITSERRYRFDFTLKGPGNYRLEVTHLLEGGL